MAKKAISRMGLDPAVVRIFNARQIYTAKDALGITEMELMELLDMPVEAFEGALRRINECACPPVRTVLSILKERSEKEVARGHLSTQLKPLDDALCGGLPFGVVTELVGPPGVGKSQLCFTLAIQAAIPLDVGGLGGGVVYIDTERKFSASRMLQIGRCRYPNLFDHFNAERIMKRIIVLRPGSAKGLVERWNKTLQATMIEQKVRLLVIDSMATLLESESEDEVAERQELLGKQASLLKYLAESFRISVVVTNHVRASGLFQEDITKDNSSHYGGDSELWAALGTSWAHAVNIRLVLEVREGRRYVRIAKSPMSAPVAVPFVVTSRGLEAEGSEALQVNECDVMAIYRNYDLDEDDEIIPIG